MNKPLESDETSFAKGEAHEFIGGYLDTLALVERLHRLLPM